MSKQTPLAGSATRFAQQVLWCALLGVVAALLYRSGSADLKADILEMLKENSAPKSFHFLATIALTTLGLSIALFGRTQEPSFVRSLLCYRPAEVALSLCAVFVGLLFGFACGVRELSLAIGTAVAFLFSGGLLLVVVWLSQPEALIRDEKLAKATALTCSISEGLVLWWQYGR